MFALTPNNHGLRRRDKDVFNLFDEVFNDSFFTSNFTPARFNTGSFKLDVQDLGNGYQIEAELPGVKKENMAVSYKDERLYIAVKEAESKEEEKANYIHKERYQSDMSRAIYLKDVDPGQIQAKLENGILVIHAPKIIANEDQYRIDIQ